MNEKNFKSIAFNYLNYTKLKKKINTYKTNERRFLIYILEYFKNYNVEEITCNDYLEWQMYINKYNFSYNYKSNIHYLFSDFLEYCINFYNLSFNVAKKVGNFKNNEIAKIGNIWTITDFNNFIKYVDRFEYNVLFRLLFFTGLRKGEAMALTFNEIDFENRRIYIYKNLTKYKDSNNNYIINTPKTKKSNRYIMIDDCLSNELVKLKKYYLNKYKYFNNDMFVFGGEKVISFTSLERNKNKYCKISGVKQIKIHEFRHSHACLLFNNNVPINEISLRLGHSKISMTSDIYLKYLPNNEKRVINTLNSIVYNQ